MRLETAVRAVSGAALVMAALGMGQVDTAAAASGSTGTPAVHATAASGLQLTLTWQTGPLGDAGSPVAQSSPIVANLAGGPAMVVGDRAGRLYAYYLGGDGHGGPLAVPGWPVQVGTPVDSTPSVADLGGGLDTVFVGSGDDAFPAQGGYHAYTAGGAPLWNVAVQNPVDDAAPASGVSAGLTVAPLQGHTAVMAGSLGQEAYAIDAPSGTTLAGWPFFTSDSTHSTAAVADLYGTGQAELVEGGDQTAGFALGQHYSQGGHLRILNPTGGLICNANVDQTVDSSPAVGGFLAGGQTGAVVGTGSYFPGATTTDQVIAFDSRCGRQWATTLDYATSSSPALADVDNDGRLEVVEGTANAAHDQGSVWVLDGRTGAPVCHAAATGAVIGSIVTANLAGAGQDLLVPTTDGVEIFDGRCTQLATIGAGGSGSYVLGFQNAPLVTGDPNGSIGITLAGYGGPNSGSGYIEHYEVAGSDGASVGQPGAWPMFHHDAQLTGNAGGTPARGSIPLCHVPAAAQVGYDLVASDGGVFSFGQPFCGSTGGVRLAAPVVGMAMAASTGGYWLAASDGGIFTFGDAGFFGSLGHIHLTQPIVGMAATPDGRGYWLVASDGGIFTFGDAGFHGSMGGRHLAQPVVGMAVDVATGGYWEVAADGGIFSFGSPFYGSTGAVHLAQPIVGMRPTGDGHGYRFVAADGGVFDFGDAGFYGSMGGHHLARPILTMAGF